MGKKRQFQVVANHVRVKGASNCLKVSLASWVEPAQDVHTHITMATPHRALRTCTVVTLMQQWSLRLLEPDSAPATPPADCASVVPTTFSLMRSSPMDEHTTLDWQLNTMILQIFVKYCKIYFLVTSKFAFTWSYSDSSTFELKSMKKLIDFNFEYIWRAHPPFIRAADFRSLMSCHLSFR